MLDKEWFCLTLGPYGALLLFACKKTIKLRRCTYYHALNCQTKLDIFPIPCLANLLDHLGHDCFFSSVDLATTHHQIRIKQGHEHRIAFVMSQGLYKWNAPAMF